MHLQTHFALSWLAGHRLPDRRDRVLAAWSGTIPDIDGLTIVAGRDAYERWHHTFGHSLVGALVVTAGAAALARKRVLVGLLAFLLFHLHLACDLLGSDQWAVYYFWPWDMTGLWTSDGWPLGSWQNMLAITVVLAACVRAALVRGRTFAEALLPAAADRAVVETLRRRFRVAAPASDPQE